MLPPLRDSRRRTLLRLSLMVCCVSAALLPLTGGSSGDASASPAVTEAGPALPAVPAALRFPSVAVSRDPFVPDAMPDVAPIDGDVDIVLPPNAGANGTPLPPAAEGVPNQVVVRAVVIGPSSRALVDQNGKVSVLAVGDMLGGVPIQSIDSQGIVLSNGTRIAMAAAHR